MCYCWSCEPGMLFAVSGGPSPFGWGVPDLLLGYCSCWVPNKQLAGEAE